MLALYLAVPLLATLGQAGSSLSTHTTVEASAAAPAAHTSAKSLSPVVHTTIQTSAVAHTSAKPSSEAAHTSAKASSAAAAHTSAKASSKSAKSISQVTHQRPQTIQNTRAAIDVVIATMRAEKPTPSSTKKGKVPKKTVASTKTVAASVPAHPTGGAQATKKPKLRVRAPATTTGVPLNTATTVAGYGACNAGGPATASYPCAYGYGCSSSNAYYYQCLPSSVGVTLNPSSTIGAYGACGLGSPITATYACSAGLTCSSSNSYYYQCLSTTGVAAAATTSAAATTTTAAPAVAASATNAAASLVGAATSTVDPSLPCATQPSLYSFLPADTSMTGFLNETTFHTNSMSATTPAGYGWVWGAYYSALNQPGYMFYTNLATYSPATCSATCDSTAGCAGFTIYYERSPSLQPATGCLNPPMITLIRCAFYSQPINSQYATNVGQWRGTFAVVLAGANGYNKVAA
ncbi:hypothetical protein ANO11243_071690 [Dothideomycetidae sp. 11243]|nr:hypothetical protein ANO11243_071690 [fungal sp. No.11243]